MIEKIFVIIYSELFYMGVEMASCRKWFLRVLTLMTTDLSDLHEWCWCVSPKASRLSEGFSNKSHICILFVLHEHSWCESSDYMIRKRIFHKNYIYNWFVLHEVSWYVSSDFLVEWKIFHKNHNCNFFLLHVLSWCVFSDLLIE